MTVIVLALAFEEQSSAPAASTVAVSPNLVIFFSLPIIGKVLWPLKDSELSLKNQNEVDLAEGLSHTPILLYLLHALFQSELLKSNHLSLKKQQGVQDVALVFPFVGNQFTTLKWYTRHSSAPSEIVFLGSQSDT